MADDKPYQEREPTQRTPKGLEIPIPTRKDVMDAIRKVSETDESDEDEQKP